VIARLIEACIARRGLVLAFSALAAALGAYALVRTPVDALPDLSDVQVIVRTPWPGQAPQVVEDQVTFPLTTAMLAVPGAVKVRGFSMYGDSFVYVIFAEGTDLYFARSRVLEYLSQVAPRLPPEARPGLGPDATGVGWVYQYALTDRSGRHDLGELRALQDWRLKFELQALPGVAEVASVGGMVREYQVDLDPDRLRAWGLDLGRVRQALLAGSAEAGGGVVEMAGAEYLVRASGYVRSLDELAAVVLRTTPGGGPVLLGDVAEIRRGPAPRRGIAELDGQGEVAGGIVVMRHGGNARQVIGAVKQRLAELAPTLPPGVEIVETYDRSGLIGRTVDTLRVRLAEEALIVVAVCALFLAHLRSALVVVLALPLALALAFAAMRVQGINANLMSLGGLAIAIGVMVDAAIVMIENVHRHLERARPADAAARWAAVARACAQVGPALFFSLLVVTVSFLPVFALEGQEGRLFRPLAWTKTWAMAAAAVLSVTLVPVLIGYLVRGRIRPEHANPLSRALAAAYRPLLAGVLRAPWAVLAVAALVMGSALWPALRLGSEFMPELDEGDLMYMPTTAPALSPRAAGELLALTDRLIKTVPEVDTVFGKIGRAETATDPAPLTMIETLIRFKPRAQWRPGVTREQLRRELDERLRLPGVSNAWVMPIRTRIEMLATGFKTPVGVLVSGPELDGIEVLGERIAGVLAGVPGTVSAYAERTAGARYLTVDIDRLASARYGLAIADVQAVVRGAVGGETVFETVEGRERYGVRLRYPQHWRDSPQRLATLPIVTPDGAQLALGDVATLRIEDGPAMIQSEDARLVGRVFVDISGRDLGGYVADARAAVTRAVAMPPGYTLTWSGQFESLERARTRLAVVAPAALAVIVLLLYLHFGAGAPVAMVLGALPLALSGGVWLVWALDYHLSVAVAVGFIALAGVAAETGVVMLVYLQYALADARAAAVRAGRPFTRADLRGAVTEGALSRLRPKLMTVAAVIGGLAPIMLGGGAGSEVMRRIAAPMVGGMVSAAALTLVVIPALFWLVHRRGLAT
jgi:copper/silver efflux system protein